MDPLLSASALDLASWIRRGDVTSQEVVAAHVSQIERVNPTIRAVVAHRFEHAKREAFEADARQRREGTKNLPPLHGVPCTIKESFAVAGLPNSGGLVARKDHRAPEDAVTVKRLRAAGAIPLGVTNLSELCMWMESDNQVYGRSNNPYDPARIVGGSSGGEGAIVGAGASPFGLGADIGGSIRMPAFFNGVFGHKPTGTLVPGSGQFPIAHGSGLRMMTTGPICRRAADLMPLLRTLAGPDAGDPECRPFTLDDPSRVKLRGLRVVSIEHNGFMRVSDELLRAQRRAADHLRSLGAHVVHASVKSLRASLPIWSAMMAAAGGPTYCELLGNGEPIAVGREWIRWLARRTPYTFMSLVLATVEKFPLIRGRQGDQLLALAGALRQELVDLIGDGVMLYPSFPKVAPKHGEPLFPPVQWTYTAILNALELPSTQVPLGLNDQQLPLGVQVVTVHGQDHRSIAVALELERAFGGWTPPAWCENDRWNRSLTPRGEPSDLAAHPPVMTTLPAPL